MPRSFQDIIDHADELAAEFDDFDAERDLTTPEMLLRRAAWKRAQAEREVVEAVVEARDGGVSWTIIGGVLGTSSQAAQKRYSVVAIKSNVTRSGKGAASKGSRKAAGTRGATTRAAKQVTRGGAKRATSGRVNPAGRPVTARKRTGAPQPPQRSP